MESGTAQAISVVVQALSRLCWLIGVQTWQVGAWYARGHVTARARPRVSRAGY